ncbi:xanthine dehydrogenase/oxidase-like [Ptychodera flava]|uniref:xanthine dehydrogenase/oxidase-like n=1 Tax=Ptychodera flava TaxID=63121 RepID=UPI00396A0F6A
MANTTSDELIFFVNGKKVTESNADPEMTLLRYLRTNLRLTGTKLGCAEGGCGACTVMVSKYDYISKEISHFSVNACLAPVCAMHGLAVTTVEGIGSMKTKLHPVQERLAKAHGSQCGFCTPGIVMSMYTTLRNSPIPSYEDVVTSLEGNLCRCTGYRPILEGFRTFTKGYCCGGNGGSECCRNGLNGCEEGVATQLFKPSEFLPYDPTQEPIFPPELMNTDKYHSNTLQFSNDRVKWIRPTTLARLLDLKNLYPHARLVNGNTEIGVEVKFKDQFYPVYLAPSNVPELTKVEVTDEGVTFGAAVSLSTVENVLKEQIERVSESKTRIFAAVVEMLRWFAGRQIRNTAVIGGNIMTASPISDLNPIFLSAGCKVTVASASRTRQLVMDKHFFTGYRKTILEDDEILLYLHLPLTRENEYFHCYKQSPRREDDIAIVNAAMRVVFESGTDIVSELAISYGGMAPTTVMAEKTINSLIGRRWRTILIDEVCKLLDEDLPLSASAPGGMVEYRKTLSVSLFFKFYLSVLEELNADGIIEEAVPSSFKSCLPVFCKSMISSTQMYQEVSPGQPIDDAVGRPIVHTSAFQQTTGEAVYVDDMTPLQGELYMVPVLSKKAHAYIRSVDAKDALAVKGVHAFVSHSDVPGNNIINHTGGFELFASEKVMCVGQAIGVIVADSYEIAQKAVKLVSVNYDELEPVITIQDAIAKEQFHELQRKIERGCVQEGFEDSDHIIEGEMKVGGQEHFYLETQVTRAIPTEDNGIELDSSTQQPSIVQEDIATALNIPKHKITVRVKRIGGGFGCKESSSFRLSAMAAVAAHRLGIPVRCMLDRDIDMSSTGTRHPLLVKYKVGCSNNGRIKALDIKMYLNVGCFNIVSVFVLERAMLCLDNSYNIPCVRARGYGCRTNIPAGTAFRAVGTPLAFVVTETWITDIAIVCGISQEKVREINMYQDGDVTHYNHPVTLNHSLQKCGRNVWKIAISEVVRKRLASLIGSIIFLNYGTTNEQRTAGNNNRWKKRGIAICPVRYPVGIAARHMNQAGALVHVYADGSVLISHGGVEMGQGLHTKMIQVASSILKIPTSKIFINHTDTSKVPNSQPTAGSLSSELNGNAVRDACENILQRLEPFMNKGSWEDWVKAAYFDRTCLSSTGFYRTPVKKFSWDDDPGAIYKYFTVGAACSEVEIDCLTGDHRVLRTDIVMDLGESLNPAIDIGQIEGAFMQGYGLFTMEDLRRSANGVLLTRGPGMYKIPSFGDVPSIFNVSILSNCPNENALLFSSKAVGEPPLLLAMSVFFAIKDAIASARRDAGLNGIFRLDSPATAEAIRMACQDDFTEQFPPAEPGSFVPWFVRP